MNTPRPSVSEVEFWDFVDKNEGRYECINGQIRSVYEDYDAPEEDRR